MYQISMDKKIITSFLVGATLAGGSVGAGALLDTPKDQQFPVIETTGFDSLAWDKPVTDDGWAEDVKGDYLHIKTDAQLEEMLASHTQSLAFISQEVDDWNACPECKDFELSKNYPELTNKEHTDMLAENKENLQREYQKLRQVVERITKEIDLRERGVVATDEKVRINKLNIAPDKVRVLNP